jgi:glycosyltransferase involved in cell wall biosynthesis
MNVSHYSFGNKGSGAFNAAYRIYSCLKKKTNTTLTVVNNSYHNEQQIFVPNRLHRFIITSKRIFVILFKKFTLTKKYNPFSFSILPSFISFRINKNESSEIIHLHWVNFEMISIFEIGNIKKPIVWTIHDLWPISGISHLEHKYQKSSLIYYFDFFLKSLKRKYWKNKFFYLVAPSTWMLNKILENKIITNFKAYVIPNPIDITFWKNVGITKSSTKIIIGYGAYNFLNDKNKGYDLFLKALITLNNNKSLFKIVTFGDKFPEEILDLGFEVHNYGVNLSENEIREFYSSIDILVVPSRIESFGQVATEAMACGCPVIGFNNSGLYDIVEHKKTGYLAKSYDSDDLANGILWYYQNYYQKIYLSNLSVKRIKDNFSYEVVSKKYFDLYSEIIQNHK